MSSPEPDADLTWREAFDAMALFMSEFYAHAGDDLVTLMADITWERDALGAEVTLDPAAWGDWENCVRQIIEARTRE